MSRFKSVALCYALLATATLVSAQTLGDISGEVKDPTGAILPGAAVTITNSATNASRSTVTNDAGLYAFPALQPGLYNITAELKGFKKYSQNGIELQVQGNLRVDIAMTVGDVSEILEVTAQGALLATENATVGTVVEQKRIVELPINGRNYLSLAGLAPNVSAGFPSAGQADGRQGGDRANQNISVAGMRNQFNRFTLDGVENTDPNFNTYVIFPSVEALQEFKVQSGVYPAEFGRGATQINVSTKGGGNQYHGSLFEFVRNDKLDAKNYAFTTARPPKDPFKWNQYGFTLGGPVTIPKLFDGKNRLFFMSNYEWFRQRRNVQAVYSLPSAQMRTGNFSQIAAGIFDPASRRQVTENGVTFTRADQFAGNQIPTSRFDPVSLKLLSYYPTPNIPGNGLINNHQIALGRPINKDQFIQRFDWVESSKSNWFGRYSRSEENQLNGALSQNGEKIVTNASQWMFSNSRVFTNTLVNEFRFGLTKFYNTTGPELAFTTDVVGALAIPGLASGPPVQWGIPSVDFAGVYSGLGNSSEGPYENNNRAMQFINNLSWNKGKHSLKFGGEVRKDEYNQVGNQFARGQFGFQRIATNNFALNASNAAVAVGGDPFADFMLGQLNQSEAAVSIARGQFRATGFAFYIDDTWRLNSKLTISMGLRYENTPPWTDQTGTLFNAIVPNDIRPTDFRNAIVTDQSLHPYFLRQGAPRQNCYEGINLRWVAGPEFPQYPIQVRCDGSLGDRLVNRDNNDWAPRLGISYQLNSKTVIRTGFGAFYSQDTGNPRFDMSRNLAGRLRDNANTLNPQLRWSNALASIAGGVANVNRPYSFANPPNRRTPYSMQYLLNIQRELSNSLVFEIGYLGSVSHRLEQLRAVNETVPAPRATGLSLNARSPFPEFGRIQLVDNSGNANYNSLGTKLTKRYSSGLTALVSYTYSRSIDTGSAIRNQGGDTLFPQNSYCRQCERARSSFDVGHRFVTSILYDLPVGKGRSWNISNGFANAVIGGWQVGSIVTFQSGFPITITQSGDPSNTGGQFDRPVATTISPYLDNPDPQRWYNPAAFSFTPDGSFGNVGRNTVSSPPIRAWDFSALKNFAMPYKEGHQLQFRFEAFNVANHPIWGNPDTNINSGPRSAETGLGANFGRITGTRTNMRNLQLGLRYTF
ncbi:hypothetical protein F183_A11130 [Bryobacterales bacterium F-183]|nr:hypothetical protein F183_A11130 [Bryobacterales bacterium F-183]